MSNLFSKLELEAFRKGITPRTKESRAWFQKKASQITSVNRKALMRAEQVERTSSEVVGHMYCFFYDPKHKKTLPYYDRFPLAIIVGPAPGGFYGLNLHYLPLPLRAKFLDALLDITNNNKYDDSTKFKMSYNLLQRSARLKYFKPCLKHYLADHVQGNFARIAAPEYEIAVFLPTADWKKADQGTVYKDSRKMI